MCMRSTYKRKQYILPQNTLNEVRKLLGVRTETEAVIYSLKEVLRSKRMRELIQLSRHVHFDLTHKELKRQRSRA